MCAKISNEFVAVKQPAQPQEFSLSWSKCGALSVPRKNLGDPEIAASNSAIYGFLFTTGDNKNEALCRQPINRFYLWKVMGSNCCC